MKYLIFGIVFFLFLLVLSVQYFFKKTLKRRLYQILLLKNLPKHISYAKSLNLFAGIIALKSAEFLVCLPKLQQIRIASALEKADFKPLHLALKKQNPLLAQIFSSVFIKACQLKNIITLAKKEKSAFAVLAQAMVYETLSEYQKLESVLCDLKKYRLTSTQKAFKSLFEARVLFYRTDLKKACQNLFRVIKFFKRKKLYYELAESYFLLAEIYRIFGAYDLAEQVFDMAQRIYLRLNHTDLAKKTEASKGVLYMAAERFEKAEEIFTILEKEYQTTNKRVLLAEIFNQHALLLNITEKYQQALNYAKRGLNIHTRFKNKQGMTFSNELCAIAYFNTNALKKAQKAIGKAYRYNHQHKNTNASLENLFIMTKIHLINKEYTKAQKTYQEMQKIYLHNRTCFSKQSMIELENLIGQCKK